MINDKFKEIKSQKKGIYKEKGSKFFAFAYPVHSENQIKENIEKVKILEHGARHYCYAYVLHADKSIQRANDDGEPSSTGGKPILGQILSNDLTNILIVVARYFGGIKLGVPGLILAYKSAAANAISKATIITNTVKEEYAVIFKYPQMNYVMRIIKEHNLEVINTVLKMECKLIFAVDKNKSDIIVSALQRNHELKITYIKDI